MLLKPERVGCQFDEKKDGPKALARLAVGSVREPERRRDDDDDDEDEDGGAKPAPSRMGSLEGGR